MSSEQVKSHPKWCPRWIAPVALVVVSALLAYRFFTWVSLYAVNILFQDQWDFWTPVFNHSSWWDIFNRQHVHRQGIGFVITVLLANQTGWNTRTECFMIAGFVVAAMVLCLLLCRRLLGRWSPADLVIPVLFLSSLMVGTCVQIPNLSHGVMPLFLLLCYALSLTIPNLFLRYALTLSINFLATYTGFGFFIGILTPVMVIIDGIGAKRRRDGMGLWLAVAAFFIAVGTLILFFHGFIPATAVADFKFPDPHWYLYPQFMALIIANAAGVDTNDITTSAVRNIEATVVGWTGLLAALWVFFHHFRRLIRPSPTAGNRVITLLIGYSLMFLASCAVGRLLLGLDHAREVRYVPLTLPLIVGIYLHLRSMTPRFARGLGAEVTLARGPNALGYRWALARQALFVRWTLGPRGPRRRLLGFVVPVRPWAVGCFAILLIAANARMRGSARRDYENTTMCKQAWIEAFLKTGSIADAEAITGGAQMHPRPAEAMTPDRIELMRRNHFNFFHDADVATYYWSELPAYRSDRPKYYLDPTIALDDRIEDLMRRLTLEEKVQILNCGGLPSQRLQIQAWNNWNESSHGVGSNHPATEFPVAISMAATWDPALVRAEADAISDEARALYDANENALPKPGLTYRTPVLTPARDPLWGGVQETFGEDPTLASAMGVSFVRGLQGGDPAHLKLAAVLRGFAASDVAAGPAGASAQVPDRMLHEYYLPEFQACVTEGGAAAVLAASNAVNHVPCPADPALLTNILRNDWSFKGYVSSDIDGTEQLIEAHKLNRDAGKAVAMSMQAGCDVMNLSGARCIAPAVRNGTLPVETVDAAVRRVLRVGFRLGVFDPAGTGSYAKIPMSTIDSTEHRTLALRAAQEGIVLLTNRDHFLPLDVHRVKSISIIGPFGNSPEQGLHFGAVPVCITPVAGIMKAAPQAAVYYARGCDTSGNASPEDIQSAARVAADGQIAVIFLGTSSVGPDRTSLGLPGSQQQLLEAVMTANPKTIVVLNSGGALLAPWAKQHAPAMLAAWYSGEEGGNAIADVLFGNVNPAGRLPCTVAEVAAPRTEFDITKGLTYMYLGATPEFSFGHGLSYTTFAYGALAISPLDHGVSSVTVDITNTGPRDGDEVVQLYTHVPVSAVQQPVKRLVAFERITLKAGEKRTVTLPLLPERFAYYDTQKKRFVVQAGKVEVLVGASSADIRARGELQINQPLDFKP